MISLQGMAKGEREGEWNSSSSSSKKFIIKFNKSAEAKVFE